jgi:endonuclease YncB( thermonuclease family)
MKVFFLFLMLSISALTYAQKEPKSAIYDFSITRIIDGDTVAFRADFLPDPLKKELSIRVYGVDTPEKGFRAKCEKEGRMGTEATKFTFNLLKNATRTQIVIMDWDKYGGRVLGDILIDGKSLREMLIEKGYARPYFGEAKQSWC